MIIIRALALAYFTSWHPYHNLSLTTSPPRHLPINRDGFSGMNHGWLQWPRYNFPGACQGTTRSRCFNFLKDGWRASGFYCCSTSTRGKSYATPGSNSFTITKRFHRMKLRILLLAMSMRLDSSIPTQGLTPILLEHPTQHLSSRVSPRTSTNTVADIMPIGLDVGLHDQDSSGNADQYHRIQFTEWWGELSRFDHLLLN